MKSSDRLQLKRQRGAATVGSRLRHLANDTQHLPILDPRHPDEIIDYDRDGLPQTDLRVLPPR